MHYGLKSQSRTSGWRAGLSVLVGDVVLQLFETLPLFWTRDLSPRRGSICFASDLVRRPVGLFVPSGDVVRLLL